MTASVRIGGVFGAMLAAVVTLAGCGGFQAPGVAPETLRTARVVTRAQRQPSWMKPEAKTEKLLYVSDQSGSVYVFSYPGGALVGTLTGFLGPSGICSDTAGNVFITDTPALQIFEYPHAGKKPVAMLGDLGYYPDGCSVDPKTGNLAVTNYASSPALGPGGVSVYANATGRPTTYTDPAIAEYFFCSYDADGNLFVDGTDYGSTESDYAELPQGNSQFTDITLDKSIGYPGGIQWDGSALAIQDASKDVVYRAKVAGSEATVIGTTHFKVDHSTLLAQLWIQHQTIILPYSSLSRRLKRVGLWNYPRGGAFVKSLRAPNATELFGVTVSVPPK